jgi:hypothetical protein
MEEGRTGERPRHRLEVGFGGKIRRSSGGDREERAAVGIGRRRKGAAAVDFLGTKLGFGEYLYEMGNFYRAAYRAGKNRAVPRAGTMGRSCGPGTIDLSCRAGPKHYRSCLVPG